MLYWLSPGRHACTGAPLQRAHRTDLGEEVGATVYVDAAAGLDEEALRAHMLATVARFKVPRYIRLQIEPLPRIASGKVNKRLLREEARVAL